MKSKLLLLLSFITLSLNIYSRDVEVKINSSESDAKIYQDGKLVGTGSAMIIMWFNKGVCTVEIKKTGYLVETLELYYDKLHGKPKKEYIVTMRKDDSYEASSSSDQANIDIEVKTTKKEDEAWRLISEIVTSKFDVIETSDKSTGYLRTAWTTQTFNQNTIRTRVIVKSAGTNPLRYKFKLISEYSGQNNTSIKSDELFKPWDRVLRKYEDVISELQSRLK